MQANQRMIADDGKEVVLFPFPYLYMTQDEGSDFSHGGTKNIDIVGWNGTNQVLKAPMYAPCSMKCVAIWDSNSNNRVWESLDYVHTPLGLHKICIATAHDDNPPSIGTIVTQGQVFAHTGTTGNVTGDHSHYNMAITPNGYAGYQGHSYQGRTNYDLVGSESVWNMCYINDTIIVRGFNHNWQTYQGGIIPPIQKRKSKYKWLFFRNKGLR